MLTKKKKKKKKKNNSRAYDFQTRLVKNMRRNRETLISLDSAVEMVNLENDIPFGNNEVIACLRKLNEEATVIMFSEASEEVVLV